MRIEFTYFSRSSTCSGTSSRGEEGEMVYDLYLPYQMLRRLTTPFEKWEAHKLGIIDADGHVLKKRRDLTTSAEYAAFGLSDGMVLTLKKLLEKLPGGKTRPASYAAALFP